MATLRPGNEARSETACFRGRKVYVGVGGHQEMKLRSRRTSLKSVIEHFLGCARDIWFHPQLSRATQQQARVVEEEEVEVLRIGNITL